EDCTMRRARNANPAAAEGQVPAAEQGSGRCPGAAKRDRLTPTAAIVVYRQGGAAQPISMGSEIHRDRAGRAWLDRAHAAVRLAVVAGSRPTDRNRSDGEGTVAGVGQGEPLRGGGAIQVDTRREDG